MGWRQARSFLGFFLRACLNDFFLLLQSLVYWSCYGQVISSGSTVGRPSTDGSSVTGKHSPSCRWLAPRWMQSDVPAPSDGGDRYFLVKNLKFTDNIFWFLRLPQNLARLTVCVPDKRSRQFQGSLIMCASLYAQGSRRATSGCHGQTLTSWGSRLLARLGKNKCGVRGQVFMVLGMALGREGEILGEGVGSPLGPPEGWG